MTPAARDWLDGLRRFSEEHRATEPAFVAPVPSETGPPRHPRGASPSAAALTAQGTIIAGHARSWGGPKLIAIATARPDEAIVYTTSSSGLGAAAEVVASLPEPVRERVAIATELEYRFWCMRSPDEPHRLHGSLWSWIKAPLPPQRRRDFARYPIAETASYWLLRYGFAMQGDEWRSADLYSFDGVNTHLLATGVRERFHSRD